MNLVERMGAAIMVLGGTDPGKIPLGPRETSTLERPTAAAAAPGTTMAAESLAYSANGGGRPTGEVPDWPDWWIGHPFVPAEYVGDYPQAFRKVPIVASAIGLVQHDLASLPRKVWIGEGRKRREQKPEDGNLAWLLAHPNPMDSSYQHFVNAVGSVFAGGNDYWFLYRDRPSDPPSRVWSLSGHNYRAVPSENRTMARFEYNRGGVWEPVDSANILHIRDYNPEDEPVGMSRLEPVRKSFEASFYALIWLKEFFRKGGTMAGAWSIKDPQGRMAQLNEADLRKIGERIDLRTQGYDKAWNNLVVQQLEFVKRGMTLNEMQVEQMINLLDCQIARAIGVPPWMLGLKEQGGLGQESAKVDERSYWTGTITRIATLIASSINSKLIGMGPGQFPPDLTFEFDFSRVPAIQAARLDMAKSLSIAAGRAFMDVDESRDIWGYAPRDPAKGEEADTLFQPPAPTTLVDDPEDEDPPADEKPKKKPAAKPKEEKSAKVFLARTISRESLRRRAVSGLARHEARILSLVMRRMGRQEEQSLARFRERYLAEHPGEVSAAKRATLAIDLNSLFDQGTDEEHRRVREILRTLMAEVGAEKLEELLAEADVVQLVEVSWHNQRVNDFLDRQTERAITVPDGTSAVELRATLAEGIGNSESLGQLEERIRNLWLTRSHMAATIARTEVGPAYNFASTEVWRQNSDILEGREWLSAEDDAVRPEHQAADGQIVRLDEPFKVGGELLDYPGDPSASPELSINCRCTAEPVVKTELRRAISPWQRWFQGGGVNGHVRHGGGLRRRDWWSKPVDRVLTIEGGAR